MLHLAGQRSENMHIRNFNFNYGANTWGWVVLTVIIQLSCLQQHTTSQWTQNQNPDRHLQSPVSQSNSTSSIKSPNKFGWRYSRQQEVNRVQKPPPVLRSRTWWLREIVVKQETTVHSNASVLKEVLGDFGPLHRLNVSSFFSLSDTEVVLLFSRTTETWRSS